MPSSRPTNRPPGLLCLSLLLGQAHPTKLGGLLVDVPLGSLPVDMADRAYPRVQVVQRLVDRADMPSIRVREGDDRLEIRAVFGQQLRDPGEEPAASVRRYAFADRETVVVDDAPPVLRAEDRVLEGRGSDVVDADPTEILTEEQPVTY